MVEHKDEWMGLSEAAELLGVHPSTVRAWADSGRLPVHRTAGGHRRFLRTEINAFQRESETSGAQIVIENVIGRTRLQVAEGRLENQPWYRRLTEAQRAAYREESHRLLQQINQLIGADSSDEARLIGLDYARISMEAKMTLIEAVEAFLFFRGFLMESIYDLHEAQSGQGFHQQAAQFTDRVLVTIIESYQAPETV